MKRALLWNFRGLIDYLQQMEIHLLEKKKKKRFVKEGIYVPYI